MKKLRISLLLTLAVIMALDPSIAMAAVSKSDFFTAQDIEAYEPKSEFTACQVSIQLKGNDHPEMAYNYLYNKLANDKDPGTVDPIIAAQAAGIVGNLMWESGGVNPTITNEKGAHGIAQWLGPRLIALKEFAKRPEQVSQANGEGMDSLTVQLNFLWHELETTEKRALAELRKTSDPTAAAKSWEDAFERSRGSHIADRVNNANEIYKKYGGSAAAATAIGSQPSCTGNGAIDGTETKFIDGFTVYSQYDPAWADKPYSSSTIGSSGCGPSAMAMIITALTGQKITPVDTAKEAASQGMYVPGDGSKWIIGPVLAKHWGLTAEPIGGAFGPSVVSIAEALKQGKLVITSGKGALPFTADGHFIVIRAVTASGKFKVGDSGHRNTSEKEWDPQALISHMKAGSVYAIGK